MKRNVRDVIQDLRDSGYKKLYVGVFPHWDAGFRSISDDLEKYNYMADVEVSCYGKERKNYMCVIFGEDWDEK